MSRSLLTVLAVAATTIGLILPEACQAQFVPYSGLGYYGWGGYPYAASAQIGANMQAANALRQADTRAAANRISQRHQQANQALVQNARLNATRAEQSQQDVNRLRMELSRSQTPQLPPQSSQLPAAEVSQAEVPLPAQPAEPTAQGERTKLVVKWPSIFLDPRFEEPRTELEALADKIKPLKNGLTSEQYDQFYQLIVQMVDILKKMQKEMNVAEYNLAGEFLNSLVLEARSLVKKKASS